MSTTAAQNLAERWAQEATRLPAPDGPEWLNEARNGALRAFATGGLPHRKVEAWKYTPIKRLEMAEPGLAEAPAEQPSAHFEAPLLPDAAVIVDVVDGVLPATLPQSPRGVAVLPDWVVQQVKYNADYITRPLTKGGKTRRLYAATRAEDTQRPFVAHLIRLARQEAVRMQRR